MHARFIRLDGRAVNLAQVVEAYWEEAGRLVLVTTAVDTVRDEDDPDVFLTIPHLITVTGEAAQRVWNALDEA